MKQTELYGFSQYKTPELKRLSKESVTFDRAYCQYPLCGPSRASLFLSKYPFSSSITWNQGGKSEAVQKKAIKNGLLTMPAYFKKHGYLTVGGGKLYHNTVLQDNSGSYDFSTILNNKGKDGVKVKDGTDKKTNLTDASDYGIYEHRDGVLIKNAKVWIEDYKQKEIKKPFLMCLGLKKPHSPFSAPKAFFKQYDPSKIEVSSIKAPDNIIMKYSLNKLNSLFKGHADTMNYNSEAIPEKKQKEIIQAYSACVSYVDYLIGDLIKTVKKNGLYNNTIIIFTSDHGYKLGEYNRWAKFTLHEKDTVVPFLIRVPNIKQSIGKKSKSLIGLIDIFPTIAELCSLPKPQKIDGKSFVPVLHDTSKSSRQFIHTYIVRNVDSNEKILGASIMSKAGYRYTQWWNKKDGFNPPESKLLAQELYDHYSDNNTAISLENLYKSKPELLKQMYDYCNEIVIREWPKN